MNSPSDAIGNRTRDLPACSAVPQPTAPPSACSITKRIYSKLIELNLMKRNNQVLRNVAPQPTHCWESQNALPTGSTIQQHSPYFWTFEGLVFPNVCLTGRISQLTEAAVPALLRHTNNVAFIMDPSQQFTEILKSSRRSIPEVPPHYPS
jgi:hypothetical protein